VYRRTDYTPPTTKGGKIGCAASSLTALTLLIVLGLFSMGDCGLDNSACEDNAQRTYWLGLGLILIVGASVGLLVRHVVNWADRGANRGWSVTLTMVLLAAALGSILYVVFAAILG
jgi:hypothetical protein